LPYLTELFSNGTGLRRVGQGVLTGEEILQALRSWPSGIAEPERITHGLVDLTGVTSLRVTLEDVKTIADIDRKNAEDMNLTHVAMVAPTDLLFGMSRLYEGLAAIPHWNVNFFRTLDEAEAWLDAVVPAKGGLA
jgi:hypothetical protein